MKDKLLTFVLNDSIIREQVNPSLPLLDFIRRNKKLTGTKEVCKEGDCGACTVLLGEFTNDSIKYKTVTSCIYPLGNCINKHVVTIEGINEASLLLQQQAFVDEHASQCGFCTPGFIMSVTCYLLNNETYKISEAINSISGNVCRCTGYHSIERALLKIITTLKSPNGYNHLHYLIQNKVIPNYFKEIGQVLKQLDDVRIANNKSPVYIGGGSDLFVQRPESILEEELSFLNARKLNDIKIDNNSVVLGSGVTFEDIKQSSAVNMLFPEISNHIDLIASLPVRNAATLGGNLVNASPIGDLTIILLALNSQLTLNDNNKTRELPLKDFYIDYKKLEKTNKEFIESIKFDIPQKSYKFNFEKVSKRTYLDIASVNTAILVETEGDKILSCSVSAGGVAPIPKLLSMTGEFLTGQNITSELFTEAQKISQNEISPISDIRGSAQYKRLLLNQLLKAHFLKLFPEIVAEDLSV